MKRLFRSKENRMIAGLCGGLGEYWNTDPTLIRLIFVVILIITGIIPALIAYLIGWIIVPEEE
ncbi:PspC domain-containing protein [candidate division TA06 bacterium]|uniref:PspC domain-containing protein n=1 Tax=candidate division TA06 bacterium TaxID=2250710 RepID=A0A660SF25_UNCT6|nr:MAG: PspC domain-containing protein [candidate division TA06 bacterium]